MVESDLHISKLDSARRQLETAVRLYFSEADPVSIHTLTAAARRVLIDLNKARGGSPMGFEEYIKSEMLDEFRGYINKAGNFFKHANRDPEETHNFNPAQSEFLLYDACSMYKDLTGELVPTLHVYAWWFAIVPGASLVDTTKTNIPEQLRTRYTHSPRSLFFQEALPLVSTFGL